MVYTIGEMAKMLGVPASTLRYYDKEGLLPFVARSSGGIRQFRESDIEWLRVIGCMKKAGMSIKDIRQYLELSMQGNNTIDTRLAMFRHQREVLQAKMDELQHTLRMVEYKCWYYETAQAAGTVEVLRDMPEDKVPEQFRAIRQELKKAGSSQWGMVLSAVFFCTRSAPAPAAQTPQWPGHPVQSRPPGRPYSRPAWKGPS